MYYFYYAISLLCLSQASIIIKWSAADPLILGAWRLFFAGILLLLWSKIYLPKEKVRTKDISKVIVAGFAFFAHLFFYAYSARHTTVSHLMLIFSLNPVTTALGSWIFHREKVTGKQMIAYLLAIFGVYLLALEKVHGTNGMRGDLMAFAATVTFSAYALLSQRARQNLPNSVFASRMYLSGSFFFFITAMIFGLNPLEVESIRGWEAIGLLTIFPTLLGHGIFTYSMKHLSLSVLSLGKLIEPGLAAISAHFIFGENLSSAAFFSSLLIFSSVVLVIKAKQ